MATQERRDIRALLWIDLECTGLDPFSDEIVEVGVLVTDLRLEVQAEYEALCRPSAASWERAMAHPIVRPMHEASGLRRAVEALAKDAPTARGADLDLYEMLRTSMPYSPGELMLAGSGVSHFDRLFVKVWMPGLESVLAYPNLDLGVLRRTLRMLGGEYLSPDLETLEASGGATKAHRAMADVRAHLAEARAYRKRLAEVDEELHRLADLCR